jgi:hypothetical protein
MTNAETAAARPPDVFNARVAIIMFLVGVFSFSAFITLSTFAPELSEGDARAHALSRSAIGYAGIVKLARKTGVIVNISRSEPGAHGASSLVVLTPTSEFTFEDVERIAGPTALVVLPKWLPISSQTHPGWVGQSVPMVTDSIEHILNEIAPNATIAQETNPSRPIIAVEFREARTRRPDQTLRPGPIESLQTISAPNLTPVATTGNGKTILGVLHTNDRDGAPLDIYVLSEPDLLNTQGIANFDTARTGLELLRLLRAPDESITFDATLNGYARSRSLLRLAFEPPLLAATLSFLLVAALIAWRAATREGPAAARGRALAYGKRILADNSAALIRLAGREHTMAARYADFIRTLVAERIGVARDGSETTSAELDRIAQARGLASTFSPLAAEAASAQTGPASLAAARKLHAWTEEIIRATR